MASVLERSVSESRNQHLTELEVAAYVDGTADAESSRIKAHLLECSECRAEIVDASRLAPIVLSPARRRAHWLVPLAAAAAVLLLVVRPESLRQPTEHREAPMTATISPRAIAPAGLAAAPRAFVWTSVPGAYRYQLRLQAADGTVLWEQVTTDTTVAMPATIALSADRTYFWKVESISGVERRATSELIEFRTGPGG